MNWSSLDRAGNGTASVVVLSATGVERDVESFMELEGAWALADAIFDALVVDQVERRVLAGSMRRTATLSAFASRCPWHIITQKQLVTAGITPN